MEIPNSAIAEEIQGLFFIGHIQKGSVLKLGDDKNMLKRDRLYLSCYGVEQGLANFL